VARDGRLAVGMRILEVNGKSLLGATHEEAVGALRAAMNDLHMLVCLGPPVLMQDTPMPPVLTTQISSGASTLVSAQ
jgi:hypothetical protein